MRRETKILAAIAAAMVAVFALVRFSSEPTHKHISLSKWLDYYGATTSLSEPRINGLLGNVGPLPTDPAEAKEAVQAIREMAPQAVPFLLKWIKTRSEPPPGHEAAEPLYRAFIGFIILRDKASAAIPELAKVAADPSAPGCPFAIRVLLEMGPAGVPALTNALLAPIQESRKERILSGLRQLPTGEGAAIPILIAALNHPSGPVARDAATLLGQIGKEPDLIIPHLIAALQRNEYYVRIAAARALAHYGDHARPAVPLLVNALSKEEPRAREYFRDALFQIAPEALTNAFSR